MKLCVNVGKTDRIIRFILVIAIIILLYIEMIQGIWAKIVGIIGIILVINSIYGFCPLYYILRISTNKALKKKRVNNKE